MEEKSSRSGRVEDLTPSGLTNRPRLVISRLPIEKYSSYYNKQK